MRLIDGDALFESKWWNSLNNDFDKARAKIIVKSCHTINATVLPCKMGDVVWGIKTFNRAMEARQGVVNEMYFGEDMRLCICVKNTCRGEWGKNVFATKEEAMAEIERRKHGN